MRKQYASQISRLLFLKTVLYTGTAALITACDLIGQARQIEPFLEPAFPVATAPEGRLKDTLTPTEVIKTPIATASRSVTAKDKHLRSLPGGVIQYY